MHGPLPAAAAPLPAPSQRRSITPPTCLTHTEIWTSPPGWLRPAARSSPRPACSRLPRLPSFSAASLPFRGCFVLGELCLTFSCFLSPVASSLTRLLPFLLLPAASLTLRVPARRLPLCRHQSGSKGPAMVPAALLGSAPVASVLIADGLHQAALT